MPVTPACRFAALARLLNQAGGGDELIQLVEAGQHALNPAAAAEYLRALADTGRLAEYAREGPVRCVTIPQDLGLRVKTEYRVPD